MTTKQNLEKKHSVPKWTYDYCTRYKLSHEFCILFHQFGLPFLCSNCLLQCTVINSVTVHGNFDANWGLTCKCGGDVISRHNALMDTLAHFLHLVHASIEVEAGAGLFPDHSQSRPADILVQHWNHGRPVALESQGQ